MDEQKRGDRMAFVPPKESKRAMATAALFTMIFARYLEDNICPNMTDSDERAQFAPEILDHVIIVGGFCRDILLNRPIRDIDIIINLRELCKLQTNHLKKYHSKKEHQSSGQGCVYWKRYLEKFSDDPSNINEQQKLNPELEMMHNINYIFNSKFWLNILKNNALLQNKLSILDKPKSGYFQIEVVNTVEVGSKDRKINLDAQYIDFVDTFNIDKCYNDDFLAGSSKYRQFHRKSRQLSMSGIDLSSGRAGDSQKPTPGGDKARNSDDEDSEMDEDDDSEHDHNHDHHHDHDEPKKPDRAQRLKSMGLIEFDIDELGTDFGNFGDSFGFNNKDKSQNKSRQEYIAIEVPIYSGKVRYKLLNYDFSINTGILPLSNIIRLKQDNDDYDQNDIALADNDNYLEGPMTWLEIVENGLGECDAISDCQQYKIIRCPESAHDHCTIEAHPQTYIFWRIVQWLIRTRESSEWQIDKNLIKAVEKDYDKWLTEDWFAEKENRAKFFEQLRSQLERECISNAPLADVTQMIEAMKLLNFNDRFRKLVKDSNQVRYDLTDTINSIKNNKISNNEQIISKFRSGGYEIAEQVFKEHSVTDEQLQKSQLMVKHLTQQCEEKTKKINDLEAQNSRMLQDTQRLQGQIDTYKAANFEQQKDNLLKQNTKLEADVRDLTTQVQSLQEQMKVLTQQKQNLAITTNEQIDQLRKYLIQYQNAALNRPQNGK